MAHATCSSLDDFSPATESKEPIVEPQKVRRIKRQVPSFVHSLLANTFLCPFKRALDNIAFEFVCQEVFPKWQVDLEFSLNPKVKKKSRAGGQSGDMARERKGDKGVRK